MARTTYLLLSILSAGLALAQSPSTTVKTLEAQFFKDQGSKRVQIQYGPYTVPSRNQMNGMKDFEEKVAQKPCTDCLITWMQADLHYTNGTEANADNNLWLHHTVLVNTAAEDLVCKVPYQRFFASGNERTEIDICVNGTDMVGYYVSSDANFAMVSELMNMNDSPADAVVSITYEYIPSPPKSFAHVKPLWLDIGGCKTSELPAKADKTFQYSSPSWTATSNGRVVFMGSHLHDGGTRIDIKSNGNTVCDSVAAYGQSSAYISPPMAMNMTMNNGGMPMKMKMSMEHISSISTCSNTGVMKPGDKWSITAYYNTSEYTPMTNTNGSLEPIMGISLVYFVEGKSVMAANGSQIVTGTSESEPLGAKPTSAGNSLRSSVIMLGIRRLCELVRLGFNA